VAILALHKLSANDPWLGLTMTDEAANELMLRTLPMREDALRVDTLVATD
jgi:hypothetical protein